MPQDWIEALLEKMVDHKKQIAFGVVHLLVTFIHNVI